MASTIDALIITLGLDSKGFAEGVKGSSEQLAGFTKRLAGMFFAVRGIEDVIGYFKDLHAQLAQLGFTSRNLGVAGKELSKLGEVSELFGGQMSDAVESVQGLQSAVFNLQYKGQLSDSLLMLQRFGVAYLDASGHARKFRDVAMDAARAIERQAQVAGLDKGGRYQLALQFGFQGGIASAVAQGGKGLDEALKKSAVDQKALTEKTIQGQVALEKALVSQHEQLAAVNSTLLAKMTPAILKLNEWMQQLINKAVPLLIHAMDGLIDFFKNPPPWLAFVEKALQGLAEALGPTGTLLTAIGGLALALVSLPLAIASALGLLLAELLGKLPVIGPLFQKIAEKLVDWFGPGYNPNAVPQDARKGTIARAGTASGSRRSLAAPGTASARSTPFAVPPTPTAPRPPSAAMQSTQAGVPNPVMTGGTGTTNNVTIDSITVNTRATDAEGIARSIGGALHRKLLVANADSGQQ